MEKVIKIFLAILFFICLSDMQYGYFQFVRFAGAIGFTILAFKAQAGFRQTEMIVYIGLALLFQPFIKIALGRQIWNIVDIVVAIGLLASLSIKNKDNNN